MIIILFHLFDKKMVKICERALDNNYYHNMNANILWTLIFWCRIRRKRKIQGLELKKRTINLNEFTARHNIHYHQAFYLEIWNIAIRYLYLSFTLISKCNLFNSRILYAILQIHIDKVKTAESCFKFSLQMKKWFRFYSFLFNPDIKHGLPYKCKNNICPFQIPWSNICLYGT